MLKEIKRVFLNHNHFTFTKHLHIFTLCAFAIAQPLYDLLGKNAEFFPVRNHGTGDILLLVLTLSILIPAGLTLLLNLIRLLSRKAFVLVHFISLVILASLILFPIFKNAANLYPIIISGLILLLSSFLSFSYLTKDNTRLFLTFLSPSALIFPVAFIFFTPVNSLFHTDKTNDVEPVEIISKKNVVFLIFDELPITTLMTDSNNIDKKLFPGFYELAKHSTFYPNTSTVADFTVHAVPAILTGKYPSIRAEDASTKTSFNEWAKLPSFQHHPENLFTALRHNYKLNVMETVTSLCPKDTCPHTYNRTVNINQRLNDLAQDLSIVYLHTFLPKRLSDQLPRIDMNWSEFVINKFDDIKDLINDDDNMAFELFTNSIQPADKPQLFFHHTTLPHGPWKFLPSGKQYISPNYTFALTPDQRWKENTIPYEAFQRHILQTMYADSLLKKTISRLRQSNLFDDSIIIVTADHGANFHLNDSFRKINSNNYSNILDVPLFIKTPGQQQAIVDEAHILTIDILPTLLSALDTTTPWHMDGLPIKQRRDIDTSTVHVFSKKGTKQDINYMPTKKHQAIDWKRKLIGNSGLSGIFAGPKFAHLIGTQPNKLCSRKLKDQKLLEKDFVSYAPSSPIVPASLKIKSPLGQLKDNESLGITTNMVFSAIVDYQLITINDNYMYAMIDERQFKPGDNKIGFYAIKGNCSKETI